MCLALLLAASDAFASLPLLDTDKPSDYGVFMRYALRSSYSANYTLNSLGFRCAKDL
jgi:formylglycine-generating enzyme required for sulfatase activity